MHERQHYRLTDWRRANSELNYRRFFDVTTLAAVRVEDPEVFAATHATVLGWVAEGQVTGLRVDHPDGLADPGAYLRRLAAAAPSAWLVVEKILGPDETLPARWPVAGTDRLRRAPAGLRAVRRRRRASRRSPRSPRRSAARRICGEMEYDAKRWVAAAPAARRGPPDRRGSRRAVTRDERIDPGRAEAAVAELLASFSVYRSYLADGETDALQAAAAEATRRAPDLAGRDRGAGPADDRRPGRRAGRAGPADRRPW